jgi:hypothetical protein
MTQTNALFEIGFDEPTLVRIPNQAPQVNAYLIMLTNRQTGDSAMVTAIVGEGIVRLQALYVEFSTRFDSGEEFNTHNAPELLPFPPAPMAVRTQVPSLTDPQELYRLHSFVMSKFSLAGKKVLYEPGQAMEYLVRFAFLESYNRQVKRGWFYYDQENDLYRPTLRGAYRITWGLMQPFKALRKMALNRRAKSILKEFHRASESENLFEA